LKVNVVIFDILLELQNGASISSDSRPNSMKTESSTRSWISEEKYSPVQKEIHAGFM
jgi:hypothetical protein